MQTEEPTPHRALDRIDLESLSTALSNMEGGYYDPAEGDAYSIQMGEVLTGEDDESDPDEKDWIWIIGGDSRPSYNDMSDFANAVTDPVLSDRLLRALKGVGVFRRFHTAVAEEGDSFRELWFRFSTARQEARAIEWLVDNDLCDTSEAAAAVQGRDAIADLALADAAQWVRQPS